MSGSPRDEALDFAVLSREALGGAFRPLEKLTLTHASLTGGEPLCVTREVVKAGTAVAVIAYDRSSGTLVVIRQFRVGAALATPHAAPLELPAGLVDEGEDAATAARRELFEETGLTALAIEEAFTILSSPGLSDERVVVFLALVDASKLPARAGLADENEDIVPLAFRASDLISASDEGRIANAFLFASLQWFDRRGVERAAHLRTEHQ